MNASIEIGHVRSIRPQRCRKCHRAISAHEEAVKITKRNSGVARLTMTWYVCMECERAAAAQHQ